MTRHRKKRIAILTGDAGFGHRSSANAIAAALQESCDDTCVVEILTPLNDRRVMSFLRESQVNHDRFARDLRDAYNFGYNATQSTVPGMGMESALAVVLFRVMWDFVKRHDPDAIISTVPTYLPALGAVFAVGRRRVPSFTVVTDLGAVHRLWFYKATDAWLVATDTVRDQAISSGLAPYQVHVTGIPVDPRIIRETRDPATIRAELGWLPERHTVLAVGSKRVRSLPETLRVLNHSGLPIQVVAVAGGDDDLYQELSSIEWHLPAHIYRWVDDMSPFLHASNCVISKAGGLITAESLACGVPLILVEMMPGQEQGNADLVVQNGAGELALGPSAVLETLYHWLAQDGALLALCARRARESGRPRAAYDVADRIWRAVTQSTSLSVP